MHLAVAVGAILAAWKWGDWLNWSKYYPTLLYVLSMSLIYEYLTRDFALWVFHPDFVLNQTLVVLLQAVISVPFNIFVFLSRYPVKWGKKIYHYLMWIGIYIGTELVFQLTTRITYEHNWNLGWSLIFDCVMFPMLRLHFRKPLLAWILSIPIIIGYMLIFKVPIK